MLLPEQSLQSRQTAFDIFAARFRVFHSNMTWKPDSIADGVICCCVLQLLGRATLLHKIWRKQTEKLCWIYRWETTEMLQQIQKEVWYFLAHFLSRPLFSRLSKIKSVELWRLCSNCSWTYRSKSTDITFLVHYARQQGNVLRKIHFVLFWHPTVLVAICRFKTAYIFKVTVN